MAASKSSRSNSLLAGLRDFLAARVGAEESLCLGLSGGRDSVLLLHLLAGLELSGRLSALHVHHGISPGADDWADFCVRLCAGLGVPLSVERVTVDRNTGQGLEAAARLARYAAFSRAPAECIVLAHHAGDQAETVLFNLLRGSGVTGGAAMPLERSFGRQRLLRPLLNVSRSEIEAQAEQFGLEWVEDDSNGDTSFSRNFLRHEVMPVLSSRFSGAEACLASAAGYFAEADVLLGELAESDWGRLATDDRLPMTSLRVMSAPRLKNLLRYRLRGLGWRMPVASRLEEFVRQLLTAGPDRHPALILEEGAMRVEKGFLIWRARECR